jgi:hypothetical protein
MVFAVTQARLCLYNQREITAVNMQDTHPCLEHRHSSGGVAVGLHALGLSHPHGVGRYKGLGYAFEIREI